MDLKNIKIISCTQKPNTSKIPLRESYNFLNLNYDLEIHYENSEPLTKKYNESIKKAYDDGYDAVMLIHDDVYLEHDPFHQLERLFDKFDLIGVAGASKIELKSPALWHIMGGGFAGGNLHGAVSHGDMESKHMTSFGNYPQRVIVIDGVFMAMNRKIMKSVKFDESNPAIAHFYDIDFSLSCHTMGYKVGVGDIYITHQSPGLREFTNEWKTGERWFLKKYES